MCFVSLPPRSLAHLDLLTRSTPPPPSTPPHPSTHALYPSTPPRPPRVANPIHPTQVLVDSYGTYCESCLPATPTPDTPQDDSTTELHVWQQETLLPLTKYTLRSDKIIGQPKIFGHADYVSHVFVHGGVIQPELQGEGVGGCREGGVCVCVTERQRVCLHC